MKYKSLLEMYEVENNPFYFSTSNYEILADNIGETIIFDRALDLPQIITKLRRDLKGKLVVGAIPFDIDDGGNLYIIDSWKKSNIPFIDRADISVSSIDDNLSIEKTYIPLPQTYMEMVEKGVEYIKNKQLSKLVLSRGMKVKFRKTINATPILQRLYCQNQFGYTYALKTEDKKILIGASPEMLVSKRGSSIYSNPLAGSRPRGKNAEEDQYFAQELLKSKKDLSEHKFVVEDIVKKISPICKNISFPDQPELLHTSQLWHLSSFIQGELLNTDFTVFDAALAIHPTPAVCGVPQIEAYKRIKELEGNNRGLFTGIIGWCDENGDGDWAIAIRGAMIDKNSIFIRAGAGIVQDSIPEAELRETGVKFRTMLSSMNLSE